MTCKDSHFLIGLGIGSTSEHWLMALPAVQEQKK